MDSRSTFLRHVQMQVGGREIRCRACYWIRVVGRRPASRKIRSRNVEADEIAVRRDPTEELS